MDALEMANRRYSIPHVAHVVCQTGDLVSRSRASREVKEHTVQGHHSTSFVVRIVLAALLLATGVVIATWPAVLSVTTEGSEAMMFAGVTLAVLGGRRVTSLLGS